MLFEEIPDVTKWSRTKKILEDGKLVPETFKRKDEAIKGSSPLDESSSLNNFPLLTTSTASNINTENTNNTNTDRNWEYLEQSLSTLNEDVPIPWELIYDDGRALGLFGNYTKWNTMKSNFYR